MLSAQQKRLFLDKAARGATLELPAAEWKRFESLLRPAKLKKGELFIRPGEPARRFALILSGLMRFYYLDRAGRESTKAFRGPFEIAAPYAEMLLGQVSRSHIEALEAAELLVVEYKDFRALYDRHPCWQEVGRLMAEQHFLAKEKREFEFLQLPAAERYLAFRREQPELLARLPQYQIASYLGITPVALSRIVSQLRRARSPA